MHIRFMVRAALCALGYGLFAGAPNAAAQQGPFTPPNGDDGRIAITLVLSTGNAPAPMPAMVLRRPVPEPRNVIVLDAATADAQHLSEAVFGLLLVDASDPEGRQRSDNVAQRIRADGAVTVYAWAEEALSRLHAAERRPVRGIGNRKSLDIWVAPVP